MVARPHALALPVMVAWVAGLLSAVEHRRRPPFLLLPLITLWANLHGGFTFGLVLIGPVALEALLQAERHERVSVFAHWALFGVAALGAACLTPYGPESLLVTLRILGLGPVLALIGEWRPQDFSTVTGFELCLLGGIGFALYRGVTLPPVRLLVILGLLYMGLSAARNGELLGLLGPLFLAAPLAARFGTAEPRHGRQPVALAIAALLAAFVATVAVARAAAFEPRAEIRPEQALAAVRASGRDHLLNSYDFGGYLIAQGVPVFIDGRTELYGKDFVLRTDAAETLRDPGALFDLLSQYAIDVTMLAPGTPAAGLLDHMPGWKRIYADGVAVVHVRVAPGAAIDPHAAVIDPHAAVAD